MSREALPPGFHKTAAGTGTDWDTPFQRWIPKSWFAFGPRASQGLALSILPFPFLLLFPLKWLLAYHIHLFHSAWWYALPLIPIPVLRKWREYPVTILAIFGKGFGRLESSDGVFNGSFSHRIIACQSKLFAPPDLQRMYLSAIQYWCRWHVQLQWPFFIAGHFYFRAQDVPGRLERPGDSINGKMVGVRGGARRDADRVYWWPDFFIGLTWN